MASRTVNRVQSGRKAASWGATAGEASGGAVFLDGVVSWREVMEQAGRRCGAVESLAQLELPSFMPPRQPASQRAFVAN